MVDPLDVIARELCRQYQLDFPCDAKDGSCAGCRNGAEAILTALEAAGCPVVPVEPTEKMFYEGGAWRIWRNRSTVGGAWATMVKAAAGWWREEK